VRTLVFGGWFGSGNLGDEAILMGVDHIFGRVIPEIRIIVLSINPDYTRKISGLESIQLKSPREILGSNKKYLNFLAEIETCLITGGTPIYDYDYISKCIHWGLPIINGSRIFLFGIGAKHISSLKGKIITKTLLDQSNRTSVRDLYTFYTLRNLTRRPVTLTGDSALCYPYKLDRDEEKMVVICPRSLNQDHISSYHDNIKKENIQKLRKIIAKTSDFLFKKGFSVVFVPFHTTPNDNDLVEIHKIINKMKNRDVVILERPGSPQDFINVISSSNLVIGLRLHSLILSAVARIPYLSIEYDNKIGGFMTLTGMNRFLGRINDDYNFIIKAVERIINNGEKIESHLEIRVKNIQRNILLEANAISLLMLS
jgi:polysaccharide pyruvyl transferase WcaK-like protein